jgi:homogentisate 1,2-dioxygenase
LYRIRPAVQHLPFEPFTPQGVHPTGFSATQSDIIVTPNQLRWSPFQLNATGEADFVNSLHCLGKVNQQLMTNSWGWRSIIEARISHLCVFSLQEHGTDSHV